MIVAGGDNGKSLQANNQLPFGEVPKGLITVDVRCCPNKDDTRRVDVEFDRCRLTLRDSPFDVNIPLGIIGPTG